MKGRKEGREKEERFKELGLFCLGKTKLTGQLMRSCPVFGI